MRKKSIGGGEKNGKNRKKRRLSFSLTFARALCYTVAMEKIYDVTVVGGGIAGYSAALTLKSLKREYLWLGAELFGEKLRSAEYVRNYPAVAGNGAQFAAMLEAQMAHEGIVFTPGRADAVYAGDPFTVTAGENVYLSRAVILATGVSHAGTVKGEEHFLGRGVSYCAVCDGALYRGKVIAAVVASQKFAEEVEYLAGFAETVHAFCLYPDASFQAKNVVVHTEKPLAVDGGMRVERLVLANGALEVAGVFCLRDAAPPAALVGGLETDGVRVKTNRDLSTNLAGLFAAGDVAGRPYQYVKAAGEGCAAAYAAHAYLAEKQA